MAIRHVFVYGSLRPDDDSGQSWTKEAVSGLKSQKARLPKALLYHDQYACAVLLDSANESNQSVTGYVLSTNDEHLFKAKLDLFDQIEGYRGPNSPLNLYDRTVASVELMHADKDKPASVKAYVYHRTTHCNRLNPIVSGDWLQRKRDL